MFTLLPASKTNVRFTNTLTETDRFNMIEYLYFNNGGGVAAGDINNDGLMDLYFTSNQKSNKLYLNGGNFKFKDITEKAGVTGNGNWSTGVTMADVNGDGLPDIYVCCLGNYKGITGHNLLYINNGDLTFTEKSHEYGLDFSGFSTQAAFFDYDQDGDLDMYLVNHSVHTSRSYGPASLRYDVDKLAGDRLFRNIERNGRRYFLDVTGRVGIFSSQIGFGLGVSIGDVNNDGYPDIYVDNDFHENDYLYINNRDGTFYNQLTSMIEHTSRSSMGNDIADFNNDGNLDIVSLDMLPEDESIRKKSGGNDDIELYLMKLNYGYYYQFVRNMLQLNLGDGHFAEIGRLAGMYSTDWSWSSLFCDLDNDGYKDLYITNGIYRRANDLDYVRSLTPGSMVRMPLKDNTLPDKDLYEKMPLDPLVNYVYKNNADLTFSNMAEKWGMNIKSYSNGACFADLDNDGDLDLAVNNINMPAYLYRNNSEHFNKNHFIKFSFRGEGENKSGIGTRVTIYSEGKRQMAENYTTRGFESAVPPVIIFGTGHAIKVDSAIIRWPGGKTGKLFNLETGQQIVLDIQAANENITLNTRPDSTRQLFNKSGNNTGLEFVHRENDYNELTGNLLIPHSIYRKGPAMATGDVNNDGRADVFFGNAAGQLSVLLLQTSSGFRLADEKLFIDFRDYNDVDALFFDADNDGDQDLYVVSGGNGSGDDNNLMKDRLYINDGRGNFSYRPSALPDIYHDGSCVRAADFDRDGDLDLFVGSYSMPGAYGISPHSYLLQNNGEGKFIDVTRKVCPELSNIGMVTDASWADINNNKLPDLVIAGEWMPITVFMNQNGRLKEDTISSGLEKSDGWWFCIKTDDIDKDGDMDIIAGNLGLNSGLNAGRDNPAKLFVNDFDNNGSYDPVITCMADGKNYPVATIDQLTRQIGSLRSRFPTYTSMAGKAVEEIFPPDKLKNGVSKSVCNFESGVFINNGNGIFKFSPMPVEAQFSPVMDLLVDDFNGDGIKDILLAGNLYELRPSIGRMDASFGWYLRGTGNNQFKAEWPGESGLMIRGETEKLAVLKIGKTNRLIAGRNNAMIQVYNINPGEK